MFSDFIFILGFFCKSVLEIFSKKVLLKEVILGIFLGYYIPKFHTSSFPVCADARSLTQPSEEILSSSPAMPSTPMERAEGSSNSLYKVFLQKTANPYFFYLNTELRNKKYVNNLMRKGYLTRY